MSTGGGGLQGLAGSSGTGGTSVQGSGGEGSTGAASNSGGNAGSGGVSSGGAGAAQGGNGGAGGSSAVTCPVGSYHAVLTGPYRSGLGSNDVGATVDFSIGEAGALQGMFMGPGAASATVTGSLDCATRALSATIQGGMYGVGLALAHFSGTFNGTYDPTAEAFTGTWSIMETETSSNGGTGPWSAR